MYWGMFYVTSARARLNLFTTSFLPDDGLMAAVKPLADDNSFWRSARVFADPFTPAVWGLTGALLVLVTLLMWLFEHAGEVGHAHRLRLLPSPAASS
jgi:hypothetical protein